MSERDRFRAEETREEAESISELEFSKSLENMRGDEAIPTDGGGSRQGWGKREKKKRVEGPGERNSRPRSGLSNLTGAKWVQSNRRKIIHPRCGATPYYISLHEDALSLL
jgi:hypothetical protein